MRFNKKFKHFFLALLVIVFFLSFLSLTNIAQLPLQNNNLQAIEDLIPQPEIIITEDEGFGPSGYNFPGDGSPGNPYRIEGYNITGAAHGILIDASGGSSPFNVSFVIRNCYITADDTCIKIIDAYPSLVTIDNCTCVNTFAGNGIGIHLIRCDGAILTNNTCNNNLHTGIRLDTSALSWLEDNKCIGNGDEGIYLDLASDGCTLKQNTCMYNSISGIWNEISHNGHFLYNNVTDNQDGMNIVASNGLVIENNSITENDGFGIYFSSSDNFQFKYNNLIDSYDYGIYIDANSDNGIIHHNNFLYNGVGNSVEQAYEWIGSGHTNATWYDTIKLEGNYWSDYVGPGPYPITGGSEDPYPLNAIVDVTGIIPEYSNILISFLFIFVTMSLVTIIIKRKS